MTTKSGPIGLALRAAMVELALLSPSQVADIKLLGGDKLSSYFCSITPDLIAP
jgi:hypothetical protein